jgi:hypothetical protein
MTLQELQALDPVPTHVELSIDITATYSGDESYVHSIAPLRPHIKYPVKIHRSYVMVKVGRIWRGVDTRYIFRVYSETQSGEIPIPPKHDNQS